MTALTNITAINEIIINKVEELFKSEQAEKLNKCLLQMRAVRDDIYYEYVHIINNPDYCIFAFDDCDSAIVCFNDTKCTRKDIYFENSTKNYIVEKSDY